MRRETEFGLTVSSVPASFSQNPLLLSPFSSPLWSNPGFVSVFVPPLCVSAKYPPCVDVAGLGNEKLKLHVRQRRAPPLLLFFLALSLSFFFRRLLLANVDRKEEKRKR